MSDERNPINNVKDAFEPKNIDEFLDHEREYIKNTPLSKEPYFKAVAESLNNKELKERK